jgi:hypothetical protein
MPVPATVPSEIEPPNVPVPGGTADAPVTVVKSEQLRMLGVRLMSLFDQYRSDRRIAELRWLRNQRQYLGIYDPEVEQLMSPNRSKAYPRITRVKCITVLSHLMNLMFPGNERNWELQPAPDPDITMDDVKEAVQAAQTKDQAAGVQPKPMTLDYAMDAIHQLMIDRAEKLSVVIDDQLQELGGGQDYDYIALNREVLQSGIQYGLGLLRGPFARKSKTVIWDMTPDPQTGQQIPTPTKVDCFRPLFEFVPVWDFFPDLAAKTFASMDGYFLRKVMSKSQLVALAKRSDFMSDVIKTYLRMYPVGNYKPLEYEQELRVMGVKANVNDMKADSQKYEVLAWYGKLDGQSLADCGGDVPEDKITDELDAEIWFVAGNVIKCALDPWKKLGHDVKTLHPFLYDKDDTSPIGFGLPNAIRDSQMMVAAATRMLLDNASVTCGPNVELNTDLLRADQDLSSISSYKIWYREGTDMAAQWPAVRNVQIDSHMKELMEVITLGLKFADTETFVGPANGGDPSQAPSEPMRTAAGASMLRGNAALPFKDMVRAFDGLTQSVVTSIVQFNRVFNPKKVHAGDYNVIARGATSLIAKEVKGMQADQLVQTMTPEEKVYVDSKKLLTYRLRSRDMDDVLVSDSEAQRRQQAQTQEQEEQENQQKELAQATLRKLLSDAYKNISAGSKNTAAADAQTVGAFLDILERGLNINGAAQQPAALPPPGDSGLGGQPPEAEGQQPGGGGDDQAPPPGV